MTMSRVRKRQPLFRLSWKHIVHSVFFVVFVFVGFYYINQPNQSPYFPIRVVNVIGAKHMDHVDVQKILSPLVSHGFFGVEVNGIKNRLTQLSWVSRVTVRRIWPDQVWVTIVEKNPVAQWNGNSLLNATGDTFVPDVSSSALVDLPQLVGPEGKQGYVLQYYNEINQLLTGLHFSVSRLELTSGRVWNITLSNGMKLTLDHKDFLTRFGHFVKVYPRVVGAHASEIDYVDLRYPNGLAVKWKTVI